MRFNEISIGDVLWAVLDADDMYGADSGTDNVVQVEVLDTNSVHLDVDVKGVDYGPSLPVRSFDSWPMFCGGGVFNDGAVEVDQEGRFLDGPADGNSSVSDAMTRAIHADVALLISVPSRMQMERNFGISSFGTDNCKDGRFCFGFSAINTIVQFFRAFVKYFH